MADDKVGTVILILYAGTMTVKCVLNFYRKRRKRTVYLATIEKANSLVNSLIEQSRLNELGLCIVDEVSEAGHKDWVGVAGRRDWVSVAGHRDWVGVAGLINYLGGAGHVLDSVWVGLDI